MMMLMMLLLLPLRQGDDVFLFSLLDCCWLLLVLWYGASLAMDIQGRLVPRWSGVSDGRGRVRI